MDNADYDFLADLGWSLCYAVENPLLHNFFANNFKVIGKILTVFESGVGRFSFFFV